MEICVVARAKAKPGKEKELEAALREVVVPTQKEAGCKMYVAQRCIETPGLFQVNELWQSQLHWEAHLQTPHVQLFFKKIPDLVAAPPEMLSFHLLPN